MAGETTPAEFAKYARLRLSGTYSGDGRRCVFRLEFYNAGFGTLWPPYGPDDLVFEVDRRRQPLPREWSAYEIKRHIIAMASNRFSWGETEGDVREWLGVGRHVLEFTFGNVRSNALRVTVPREGRILFAPRPVSKTTALVRGSAPDPTRLIWPVEARAQFGFGFRAEIGPDGAHFGLRKAEGAGGPDVAEGKEDLHLAAWNGEADVIGELVKAGKSPDLHDQWGETPLLYAAARGYTQAVEALLDSGADPNAVGYDGWTALHQAAAYGDEEMAALLIQSGAKVNARDMKGRSALQLAARWGDEGAWALLLGHGAEQDIFSAAALGNVGIVEDALRDRPELARLTYVADSSTPLHWACESGHADVAEILLSGGAQVDASDGEGRTPLHLASLHAHGEVVALLLSRGADVDARDSSGQTALHLAALAGEPKVVELLLRSGADVNARDRSKQTALHDASRRDREAALQVLLRYGADVNARDSLLRTPLHIAAGLSPEGVRLLISSGADVSARDDEGGTPMYCAESGEVVMALAAAGAEVNTRDRTGTTPLHIAAGAGRKGVVEALLACGADPNASAPVLGPDAWLLLGSTTTPLEMAEFHGHREVAEILRQHGARE